MIHLAVLIK